MCVDFFNEKIVYCFVLEIVLEKYIIYEDFCLFEDKYVEVIEDEYVKREGGV